MVTRRKFSREFKLEAVKLVTQRGVSVGKPVSAGQRIMELADSTKVGVKAWVPVADAINMRSGEPIGVLLYANPLSPMTATIEQASYPSLGICVSWESSLPRASKALSCSCSRRSRTYVRLTRDSMM